LGTGGEEVTWVRRAVALGQGGPEAVGRVVEGVQELGGSEGARLTLRAALLRNARDGRFRNLWSDFHFHELRQEEESKRQARWDAGLDEEKPILLPFLRPVSAPAQARGKRVRRDPAAPLPPPHLPRR